MKRKIYKKLLDWKSDSNAKPLILMGVRQCGKTYIIREFCKNEYKNFKEVNLFKRTDVINLYKSELNSDEKFTRLKVIIDFDFEVEDSILFIDEIQESEELILELKYFCEEHKNVRIICAGSLLGVKLKRSKSPFPVGKVTMINLYPMDFEEYLYAIGEDQMIDLIKECFIKNKQMLSPLHEKALNLYRIYLFTGGMPENVEKSINLDGDYSKYDNQTLNDIIESYLNDMVKYVANDNETLKIRRIYHSLPSQLSNNSHKFQFSKINNDARNREYASPLDWLEASRMVIKSYCVKTPEIPLEGFIDYETYKLYLSDVGILVNLLHIKFKDILLDNISLYKGVIAENYVANQLIANENLIYYWMNNNQSEIDFLLYNEDGIIPIEVKAANNTQSKSLKNYIAKFNPKYAIRISTKDFGYDPINKIKSIPLYAVFLIK